MSVLVLALSVLIWGVIHSLLASMGAKEWASRRLGEPGRRYYRLAYNVFSVISFLPILWLMAILPDRVIYRIPAPWVYLSLVGQFAGRVLLGPGCCTSDPCPSSVCSQLLEGKERLSDW